MDNEIFYLYRFAFHCYNYYSNYFETNGGNSRKIWKGIKNLMH